MMPDFDGKKTRRGKEPGGDGGVEGRVVGGGEGGE